MVYLSGPEFRKISMVTYNILGTQVGLSTIWASSCDREVMTVFDYFVGFLSVDY